MAGQLHIRAFTVPKAGNRHDENEDAFAISDDSRVIALTDGATEGPFSREWATALATRFASGSQEGAATIAQSREAFAEWLAGSVDAWMAARPATANGPAGEPLPWYVQRARERGGFATLIGLYLSDPALGSNEVEWSAIASGDSCLFHFRGGQVRLMVPRYTAIDFLQSPVLLSSNGIGNREALERAIFATDALESEDRLVLATDALAAWIAAAVTEAQPREILAALSCGDPPSEQDFLDFVEHERGEGRLRNDDTTLVVVSRVPLAGGG